MVSAEEILITVEMLHQKVGRNLLLFQRLEYTLKVIVTMSSEISGHAGDLEGIKARRKAWVMKQTLGQVVGEHVESFNSTDEKGLEPSPTRKETFLSIRFSTQCEADFLNNRKSALAGFVKERNELVHHLLTAYDLNDEENRRELAKMLDDQHQRLKSEVDLTFEIGKNQFEARRELAAWLQSDEGHSLVVQVLKGAE